MATEAELRSRDRTLDGSSCKDFFVFEVEQRTKFTAPHAEKLENTYTALENLFEPIPRYRGYATRWHADLLTSDSDTSWPTSSDCRLRRFRHFKRHNYSTDYAAR